ncbi:MAG: hypothetical protein V3U33_09080 [candidate division NC10 bacterium]
MARPIGVTILAVLAILAGILFLIVGSLGLLAAAVAGLTPEEVQALQAFGALGVVLGPLAIVSGVGLLRLTVWGWWLAIVVNFVSVISGITQVVIDPAAFLGVTFGLALSLIILVYLFMVRGEFGAGS